MTDNGADRFRCICDPADLFDPPDPRPRVVPGCPAHLARGVAQRAITEMDRKEAAMKQPNEGITGVDRSADDFLSLDLRAIAHRDTIGVLVEHLRDACLVGNPAPLVRGMYQRMTHPVVGDLVLVTDYNHPGGSLNNRVSSLGYLIEHRTEWEHTDNQWARLLGDGDYSPDDDRPTDDVWYVQYGPRPGDVYRWWNCTVLAVPYQWRQFLGPSSCNCRHNAGITHGRGARGCMYDVPPPGTPERATWTVTASTTTRTENPCS